MALLREERNYGNFHHADSGNWRLLYLLLLMSQRAILLGRQNEIIHFVLKTYFFNHHGNEFVGLYLYFIDFYYRCDICAECSSFCISHVKAGSIHYFCGSNQPAFDFQLYFFPFPDLQVFAKMDTSQDIFYVIYHHIFVKIRI